jgi:hypothetical protein
MDTRRNSKWKKIEFYIVVPLMLMACSLSSAIPTISSSLTQTQTQGASTAQDTQVANQTDTPAVSTLAPSGSPSPTAAQPFNRTPTVQLPQSFTYADLTFTVTKAEITNQVSDTDPTVDPSNNTYARLSIKVANATTLDVKIPAGRFTLKLGDGTSYKKGFIDEVVGKSSGNVSLQFVIPMTETWTGAQLSLDEEGTVPGVVMLDKPQPASQYPITLTAGQKLTLKRPRPMTYTVNTAVMELDGLGVRAKIGNHYLVLGMSAYCNDTTSCYVGMEEMRLVVDGAPESADILIPIASDINYQASANVQAAFVVPDNAAKLVFEVGEVGKETVQTPIPLK